MQWNISRMNEFMNESLNQETVICKFRNLDWHNGRNPDLEFFCQSISFRHFAILFSYGFGQLISSSCYLHFSWDLLTMNLFLVWDLFGATVLHFVSDCHLRSQESTFRLVFTISLILFSFVFSFWTGIPIWSQSYRKYEMETAT